MSRFYVGQRVRIKWSRGWPELAGEVGTIVESSVINCEASPDFGSLGWVVAPDVWGSAAAPQPSENGGTHFCPISNQLEPATDSYDVTTWDTCVWKPEHLRVEA